MNHIHAINGATVNLMRLPCSAGSYQVRPTEEFNLEVLQL
jgi:hypothetical protein